MSRLWIYKVGQERSRSRAPWESRDRHRENTEGMGCMTNNSGLMGQRLHKERQENDLKEEFKASM